MDRTIGGIDLAIIARDHLTDWEALRSCLELTRQQKENIRRSYPDDYEKQKLECLEIWKETTGNEATYGALIEAAQEAELRSLADKVRVMAKKQPSTPTPQSKGTCII